MKEWTRDIFFNLFISFWRNWIVLFVMTILNDVLQNVAYFFLYFFFSSLIYDHFVPLKETYFLFSNSIMCDQFFSLCFMVFMKFTHLHHDIKLDTLSRAKNVPLFAAGKKCTLPIANIGPANPDVIDFVIDLLRA